MSDTITAFFRPHEDGMFSLHAYDHKRHNSRLSGCSGQEKRIETSILLIRGHKVLLDWHLAALYGVATKRLKEQVRRNRSRFPEDFMFQLNPEEVQSYAFTEQGVAMLSTVLNSERAIQVNIKIMRTFVRLRQMLGSNAQLARKLAALERRAVQGRV